MSRIRQLSSSLNRTHGTRTSHVFLDLFGTLIYPASPIHIRYNQIAQSNGFSGFEVSANNFKTAFKKINREFPNYGKNSWRILADGHPERNVNMSPKDWWLKVVKETFENSLSSSSPDLTRRTEEIEKISESVYEDFMTNKNQEIYKTYEDSLEFINYLLREKIEFSILTNSDPQIFNTLPTDLNDLVFSKGHQRIGHSNAFTSWDTGFMKPDRRIWDTAICQLSLNRSKHSLVHIGDDFQEDFQGAKSAGIGSIWLDRKDHHHRISKPIENKTENYQFKKNERVHSLKELIGLI